VAAKLISIESSIENLAAVLFVIHGHQYQYCYTFYPMSIGIALRVLGDDEKGR
jgi:hypothetical protein